MEVARFFLAIAKGIKMHESNNWGINALNEAVEGSAEVR